MIEGRFSEQPTLESLLTHKQKTKRKAHIGKDSLEQRKIR